MSTLGGSWLALGGFGVLASACDPVGFVPVDEHGLLLQPFFTGRVVATTGQEVPGTGYTWHTAPDGGACFPLPDGGWSYVSNSEWVPGGAGFLRFDAGGAVVDAGSCLTGSIINCAGGATPWGTWLSCEEWPAGRVFECHPVGAVAAVHRPALGTFKHEAAACHVATRRIYLTEDESDGALYRFTPTTWGDLSAGTLEVLTETGGDLVWAVVPDPAGNPTPTRDQVPDTLRFRGGEGIDISNGRVVFATRATAASGPTTRWRTPSSCSTTPACTTARSPTSTTSRCRSAASSTSRRTAATSRSSSCATTVRRSRSCSSPASPAAS